MSRCGPRKGSNICHPSSRQPKEEKLKRYARIACAAVAVVALSATWSADGQGVYPTKPIRLVAGFPPGGGIDFTARLIAQHLAEGLAQPVIVENKSGAAGVIAATEVAKATPDGYTLIIANIGPFALAPNMMAQRPYDPVKDFTAIGQVVATYFVAAVPANHPANTLREFIEWAQKNDGRVNYASGGNGSITHLNGELLNQVAGLKMTHIPYKGSAPAVTDLIAGQTHILIDVGAVLTPQIKAGKLKAIAVTSPTRDPEMPSVPTAREQDYVNLETAGWQGLVGPAGMPKDIVARLASELQKSLSKAEVRERFLRAGTPVVERGPEEFAAFIKSENERWLPLIKASGARIE
jgi:tripartite-type tricarboxylate transporter receptor subunit TctC